MKDLFPIMKAASRTGDSGYNRFSFAKIPSYDDYTNPNGLLVSGLEYNFGLSQKPEQKIGLYPGVKRYVKDKNTGKVEERAAYRQSSWFNMAVREKERSDQARLEVGVRTVAIGQNTSWSVSPVKMAEMQGRLITLNKNYSLSLDPASSNLYQLFDFDNSWGPTNQDALSNYNNERIGLVYGMSNVFSTRVSGTAHDVYYHTGNDYQNNFRELLTLDNGNNSNNNNTSAAPYYVYGKTGTIDHKKNHQRPEEDHLLAVIITNKKISTATAEELKNVKFYVLYFADYDKKNWKAVDGKIIEAVINSAEFRNYMTGSNQ